MGEAVPVATRQKLEKSRCAPVDQATKATKTTKPFGAVPVPELVPDIFSFTSAALFLAIAS